MSDSNLHSNQVANSPLHPRNRHHGRYDFDALSQSLPALNAFIRAKEDGGKTIDFSDPNAVLALNQALLAHYYRIKLWQIPPGYLCPAIPGRADYIHYVADLLAQTARGMASKPGPDQVPTGKNITVLDIGTGANCIYPIIGSQVYGWQFVGTDIDPVAVKCAQNIVRSNPALNKHVKVVVQKQPEKIFTGIIGDQLFDLTLCNPPFHASMQDMLAGSQRKLKSLRESRQRRGSPLQAPLQIQHRVSQPDVNALNFGGQQTELWCPGGELAFLQRLAHESVLFAEQVCWFSSLVSKAGHVQLLTRQLKQLGATRLEVLNMNQGQKISRVVAWSFLTPEQQQQWVARRWKKRS